MTHAELKEKVDRLHRLMADPSEGSIAYQVAVGNLVQDLCDAWGRPDPAKVAREALEAAIEAMCPVFEVARNYTDGSTDARRSSLLSAEGCIRALDIAAIIEAARKAP